MKLSKDEALQAARDRELLELDLSEVPDFSIHIPGHTRWRWFGPMAILAMVGLVYLAWRWS